LIEIAHDLVGHEVTTYAQRLGRHKNGDFMALAEKEFDAFVTVDRTRKRARSDEISNSSAASFQFEILVASKCVPLEFAAHEQSRKTRREDSQRKIRQEFRIQ
jgi:hypothetical protein